MERNEDRNKDVETWLWSAGRRIELEALSDSLLSDARRNNLKLVPSATLLQRDKLLEPLLDVDVISYPRNQKVHSTRQEFSIGKSFLV
jgi:hypothetical protein